MNQPSNAERFVVAFSKIENCLKAITRRPKYVPFRVNARVAARYNAVVNNHLEELNTYAELRNPIVHVRDDKNEILAQPTDAVTENIERIAELLQQDQSVLNYASKPVYAVRADEEVRKAVSCMDEHGFHKMPVYFGGKFMGMLSMEHVMHRLLDPEHAASALSEKISDVLDESTKESVLFLNKGTQLQEMIRMFEDFIALGLRDPVIIVTETGDFDEPPLGIITPTDMGRIIAALA